MTLKGLLRILPAFLAFILTAVHPAVSGQFDEYQVKAVFVLNFSKLSDWPQNSQLSREEFPIAIIGKVASPKFENTLQGKLVQGAKVEVIHIDEPEKAKGFRVVYIASTERHRLSKILQELRKISVLTISDIEDFCESGGMIGLLKEQNNIGFEVNLAAVRKARIDVSSRMLQLAKEVYGK